MSTATNTTTTEQILAELEANENVRDSTVDRDDVHGTDISFTHYGRSLPMGLLEFCGRHGDLRVEGTDVTLVQLVLEL